MYEEYVSYVKRHYGQNAIVIFDGYRNAENSTKTMEQKRRALKVQSVEIMFTKEMSATTTQAVFLANSLNKGRFIDGLKKCFIDSHSMVFLEDSDDADNLIVSTAINTLKNDCVVVGTDTDLLALLIHKCHKDNQVLYHIPGTQTKPDVTYNITNVQVSLKPMLKKYILFLHAVTGCDTTSALFRQGKKKIVSVMEKNPTLYSEIDIFYDKNAFQTDIAKVGEKVILALYGAPKKIISLDDLRYRRFLQASKRSLQSQVNMASLPPTSSAAREHSYRVYYQLQLWLQTPGPVPLSSCE